MTYDEDFRIEPGQVWETDISGGRTGKVVVVACQSNFANTLSIWESDIPSNMPLVCGGSVDTRRMVYTNYDNFRCMIDSVSENELAEMKRRFMESIGVKMEKTADTQIGGDYRAIIAERERDIWKQVANGLMGAFGDNRRNSRNA